MTDDPLAGLSIADLAAATEYLEYFFAFQPTASGGGTIEQRRESLLLLRNALRDRVLGVVAQIRP